MEIWKDIKGYEGLYQVSNTGKVKSLKRNTNNQYCNKDKERKYYNIHGYLQIILCKEGKKQSSLVHRLVAETFIPNPDKLPCVNHKDENKLNNNVENLEWCTYEYNTNYGTRNKRSSEKTRNNKFSRPVLQYTLNGVYIKEYPSIKEIERETGLNAGNICNCCNGKYKTAYGYIWKYKKETA